MNDTDLNILKRRSINILIEVLKKYNFRQKEIIEHTRYHYPDVFVTEGTLARAKKITKEEIEDDSYLTPETINKIIQLLNLFIFDHLSKLDKETQLSFKSRLKNEGIMYESILEEAFLIKQYYEKGLVQHHFIDWDYLGRLVERFPMFYKISIYLIIFYLLPLLLSVCFKTFSQVEYSFINSKNVTLGYAYFAIFTPWLVINFYKKNQRVIEHLYSIYEHKELLSVSISESFAKIKYCSLLLIALAFSISSFLHWQFLQDQIHGFLEVSPGVPNFFWWYDTVVFSYQVYVLFYFVFISFFIQKLLNKIIMKEDKYKVRKNAISIVKESQVIAQEAVFSCLYVLAIIFFYFLTVFVNFSEFNLLNGTWNLFWQITEMMLLLLPMSFYAYNIFRYKKILIKIFGVNL